MKMSLKELTANLAMPVIVGVMLLYFEQFFNSNNEPLAFILSIIGFVVLYAFCIVKGMGLIKGVLPIGSAYKRKGSSVYTYYISPRLFWEYTGYVYKGTNKES